MSRHSRTKIKVISTSYEVHNEITVCKMIVDPQLLKSSIHLIRKDKNIIPLLNKYVKKDENDNIYLCITQKTRCRDNDQFSVITGRRITESKCKAKAFKIMASIYDALTKKYGAVYDIHYNLMNNCTYSYKAELEHIKKLQK
jgi:outer membrane receptor for ferric coprogen and ferric-rhodotorulic acid